MIVSNINEDDNLAIRKEVKNRKLHIEKKDVKKKILKKHKPADLSREAILKKARKKAHQSTANVKRDLSNDMRKSISESAKLFESFDFIEESYGYGEVLNFQIYEEPVENSTITEALCVDHSYVDPKYLTIGMAEGCFAPIGVMSRNNRIYDEDHYPYLLSDEMLMNRVHSRAMLGTIGHHDKRVDDEDLANDVCSHVVTELEVRENAEGQPYLYGKLEILNTTAGRRLRQLYEHGIPLYVSSRGGGKLLPVPNKTYKRVDKQHYFLETFDVVKEPGFLDANPTPHVSSSVNESIDNKDNGEIVMKQELQKDTSIVEEKETVLDESVQETIVEEKETTVVDEAKEEKEAKEKEEEKVDEAKEEDKEKEADKEDEEEKVEESATETVSEEVAPTAPAPKAETEDDEDETAKGDIAKDGVHEEKEHDKDCDCEDCKAKKEEEKVDEADASSEKVLADIDKIVKTVCEEKEADEEEKEAEEKEEEKVDEAKEEVTVVEEDYKAKYEALEPVLEELINMIKDASAKIKAIQEENASHKAQIMELTEKLNVSEEQDMHQDPDDDTEVDGPADTEDKPDDMHEAKEEDKEKEEADKEDEEEKVEESVTETVSESVETEAEELGEQIAESADINISEEIKPIHKTIEVYSAFKKEENVKPSKYFSRFSNFNK